MPILNIRVIGDLPKSVQKNLAGRLADAAGKVFQSGPQHTWVMVQSIPRRQYAENGKAQPDGVNPIFVSVLLWTVPKPEKLRSQVRCLAKTVAAVCHRAEENVHVLYELPAAGRIAFGGNLVE